jgi:hypothetical protein
LIFGFGWGFRNEIGRISKCPNEKCSQAMGLLMRFRSHMSARAMGPASRHAGLQPGGARPGADRRVTIQQSDLVILTCFEPGGTSPITRKGVVQPGDPLWNIHVPPYACIQSSMHELMHVHALFMHACIVHHHHSSLMHVYNTPMHGKDHDCMHPTFFYFTSTK